MSDFITDAHGYILDIPVVTTDEVELESAFDSIEDTIDSVVSGWVSEGGYDY